MFLTLSVTSPHSVYSFSNLKLTKKYHKPRNLPSSPEEVMEQQLSCDDTIDKFAAAKEKRYIFETSVTMGGNGFSELGRHSCIS
jgi:hypothetical protein